MSAQLSEAFAKLAEDQFLRIAKRSMTNGADIFGRLHEQTLRDVLATDEFEVRDMMAAGLMMSVLYSLDLVAKVNGELPATTAIALVTQLADLLRRMMGDQTAFEVLESWTGTGLEDMEPEGTA